MNRQLAFEIRGPFSPANIYGDVTGFGVLATDIVLILSGVAASLSIIFIIISGIKLVTSGGDSKKLASASSTLTYAIIGLVVTILAFAIVRITQYFLRSTIPITP